MKKGGQKKYLIILVVMVLVIMVASYLSTPQQQWVPTWSAQDKNPFGGYVTHKLMESQFPEIEINSGFKTLYELLSEAQEESISSSLFITNTQIELDKNDSEALLKYLAEGHTALLAASSFSGAFADSLDIRAYTNYETPVDLEGVKDAALGEDLVGVHFVIPGFPQKHFRINKEATAQQFEKSSDSKMALAKNQDGFDILRQYNVGEGKLYISTTPLLFTNFYALDTSSSAFTAGLLSLLPPDKDVVHLEYYTLGRMEAQTPLRYILSHPALKAALWLCLVGIVLFMIFEARRRQRIIPLVKSPTNLSIEFVNTLGQLYFSSKGDHLNLATKRMNYFLEYVRRHYFLLTNELDAQFVKELSAKSGKAQTKVERLVNLLNRIKGGTITQEEFLRLEIWLTDFYGDNHIEKTNSLKNI